MHNNLRKLALTEEFDYNLAMSALSEYKNPRVKINDLLKKRRYNTHKERVVCFWP